MCRFGNQVSSICVVVAITGMRTAGMKVGDIVLFSKWKNEASWARHTSEFGQGPMNEISWKRLTLQGRCIESMGYKWLHSYIFHGTSQTNLRNPFSRSFWTHQHMVCMAASARPVGVSNHRHRAWC